MSNAPGIRCCAGDISTPEVVDIVNSLLVKLSYLDAKWCLWFLSWAKQQNSLAIKSISMSVADGISPCNNL